MTKGYLWDRDGTMQLDHSWVLHNIFSRKCYSIFTTQDVGKKNLPRLSLAQLNT